MANLTFSQPARRNLLVPILGALIVLAAAFALYNRLAPVATIDITAPHINLYTAHTVFAPERGDGMTVLTAPAAEDDLYVLTTLHLDNHLRMPVFLKDFTATLITAEGQLVTSSAVEKNDLPTVYTAFPNLKTLSSAPLYRETEIAPGQSAEGMVIFHFTGTKATWANRKSANVSVAFYHQPPQSVSLDPKSPHSPTQP